MPALERIQAPFTAAQVRGLNEYQTGTAFGMHMHPFTCAERGDGQHGEEGGDTGVLIATAEGWVCPWCDYTQDWAHGFMANSRDGYQPHDFEKVLSTEEKITKVKQVMENYLLMYKDRPFINGVPDMLASLELRVAELKEELSA
jgi:hypothetical protein